MENASQPILLANQIKSKREVLHRPRTNRINIIPTPNTPANLLAPLLRPSLPQLLFDTGNTNVLDVVFLQAGQTLALAPGTPTTPTLFVLDGHGGDVVG